MTTTSMEDQNRESSDHSREDRPLKDSEVGQSTSSTSGHHGGKTTAFSWASPTIFISFCLVIFAGAIFSSSDVFAFPGISSFKPKLTFQSNKKPLKKKVEYPLNCTNFATQNSPQLSCSTSFYPRKFEPANEYTVACPEYFRWIHEDLRPWKSSGISREMVESGKKSAHFRVITFKGKAYVEKFGACFQTRAEFTIWGILQLLRLYPGKLPDLDLMFNCDDFPLVMKRDYEGPNATSIAPPVFHYCGSSSSFDITFPDWSFWGWPEVNIKPWESQLRAIKEAAKGRKWEERVPYAFWKGNAFLAATRIGLMKCIPSNGFDWNARLYTQDWRAETKVGYKNSKLEDQCTHRYKIYIEGRTWSVSEKYILACDSVTLLVRPDYDDFFTRGMVPMQHYWPIRSNNKCRDIKFSVDWGNNHTEEAQAIGQHGSKFVEEDLKMKFVYDYMFHLLREYAKLLSYEPKIPPGAKEVCVETMACPGEGLFREFLEESLVKNPSDALPCSLPSAYDQHGLQAFIQRKNNITKQVELWEAKYWENLKGKP